MRYNRWVRREAWKDIERLCQMRPDIAHEVVPLAKWMIEQLADDPLSKGTAAYFPGDLRGYCRWRYGRLTVIFTLMPSDDRTVIIEGFFPNQLP